MIFYFKGLKLIKKLEREICLQHKRQLIFSNTCELS